MTHILNHLQPAAVAVAVTLTVASVRAENKIPDECKTGGFAIGCIAYTFDRFTLFEALEKTAETGGKVVELCAKTKLSREEPGVAFDYNASPRLYRRLKTSSPNANSRRSRTR